MAAKVRQIQGAWWVVTHHQGKRQKKRVGSTRADKRQAEGRAHNLFGKPDELERFNAVAKRVATELDADYVDVYEPTRTHPDKPGLFNPNDGVHLTNAGNRYIALELLKHFARK